MKIKKILKPLLFITITIAVVYLSLTLKGYDQAKIELIELSGCYHLSEDQYFKSSNLDDKDSYSQMTLRIVKDRIEKHPYVEKAEVRFETNGKVLVEITEKKFEAILILGEDQYLLSERMQVLPVMLYTRGLDYPIIRNPKLKKQIEISEYINQEGQGDIILAGKIITTIKLINSELYQVLSEIDLNYGTDVNAYFSTMSYELRIGREDVIRKMISFNAWYAKMSGHNLDEYLDYVDLRYDRHIFIGFPQSAIESWDGRS